MTSIPLALFARAPVPGRTKTRLIPALGAEGAAKLHRAFVEDSVAKVCRVPSIAGQLWWSEAPNGSNPFDLPERVQTGTDLGARLVDALREMGGGSDGALVIGTDAPTLPARLIAGARESLAYDDVVIGPSADGGYYLVGSRVDPSPLFSGVRWSTRYALADTVANASNARFRVRLLPPWYDVDTPDDLRLLSAHLAMEPTAAPQTRACLVDLAERRAVSGRPRKPFPAPREVTMLISSHDDGGGSAL